MTAPVLGSINVFHTDPNDALNTIVGRFVQGLSRITCQVDVTPAINPWTDVFKFTVDGVECWPVYYDATRMSVDLPPITKSGDFYVTATVEPYGHPEQRATATTTFSVLPYEIPKVTDLYAARCDSGGTLNDQGTSIKVVSSGSVTSLVNVTEKNQLTWSVYSRLVGATDWGAPLKTTTPATALSWTSTDVFGSGAYPITSSYEVLLECSDRLNSTRSIFTVATSTIAMSWSRTGVGAGKYWERGALDVGGPIFMDNRQLYNPAGLVSAYAGSAAPAGYLLCDGGDYVQSAYPDLYAAIGTTYGSGSSGGRFNVPNLCGRIIAGYDNYQSEFTPLGKQAGETTHALTAAENGPHTHNASDFLASNPSGATPAQINLGGSAYGFKQMSSSGGGTPHNNMPPYAVLNWIIKT